jgi:hypothetical protein
MMIPERRRRVSMSPLHMFALACLHLHVFNCMFALAYMYRSVHSRASSKVASFSSLLTVRSGIHCLCSYFIHTFICTGLCILVVCLY